MAEILDWRTDPMVDSQEESALASMKADMNTPFYENEIFIGTVVLIVVIVIIIYLLSYSKKNSNGKIKDSTSDITSNISNKITDISKGKPNPDELLK